MYVHWEDLLRNVSCLLLLLPLHHTKHPCSSFIISLILGRFSTPRVAPQTFNIQYIWFYTIKYHEKQSYSVIVRICPFWEVVIFLYFKPWTKTLLQVWSAALAQILLHGTDQTLLSFAERQRKCNYICNIYTVKLQYLLCLWARFIAHLIGRNCVPSLPVLVCLLTCYVPVEPCVSLSLYRENKSSRSS